MSGSTLTAFAARRALLVPVVVLLVPSVSYLFGAMAREGRPAGEALRGLREWLTAALLHADLGTTAVNGASRPVREVLLEGAPVDLGLVAGAMVLGVAGGTAVGVLRGPGGRAPVVTTLAALAVSTPVFLGAYAVLFTFGHIIGRWPLPFVADTGIYAQPWEDPVEYLRAIATPSLILAAPVAAQCCRMTRAALLEAQDAPHLDTARTKGLRERRVAVRHALPTAAPPVVALAAVSTPATVFNAVLVEVPFNLPGAFRLAHSGMYLDSEHQSPPDPMGLQGVVLWAALLTAVAVLACDVLGAWLDPRQRER